MVAPADVLWFKTNFGPRIAQAVQGTVFDVDMLTAIACQETGSLWVPMRKKGLTPTQIAALCCGDTLDADKGRRAFPKTKADLIAVPNGQKMFDIARAPLLAMAEHVPGYGFARTNKSKFAHGYGVFQYDLQFFKTNPDYFLNREYEVFEKSLGRAIGELKNGLKKLGLQNRSAISDLEFCHIAICYNTGGFKAARGLKQGHNDGTKFYGERIQEFLKLARGVHAAGLTPTVVIDATGAGAGGPAFRVATNSGTLRLRREPKVSNPADANVVTSLANGLVVRAFAGAPVNGFLEVEAQVGGTTFRGFASAQFLAAVAAPPSGATAPASADGG